MESPCFRSPFGYENCVPHSIHRLLIIIRIIRWYIKWVLLGVISYNYNFHLPKYTPNQATKLRPSARAVYRRCGLDGGLMFSFEVHVQIGFLKLWDPHVTMGFNTEMVYWFGWFGVSAILGNFQIRRSFRIFFGKACCEQCFSSFWGRHSMKKLTLSTDPSECRLSMLTTARSERRLFYNTSLHTSMCLAPQRSGLSHFHQDYTD